MSSGRSKVASSAPPAPKRKSTIRPAPAEADGDVRARLERLAAIGARTAEVAHELRNSLAVLETSLHLVRRSLGADAHGKVEAHLARMAQQIHAGQGIVREVLDEVRGGQAERAPVELRTLVLEAIGGIAHADGVTLEAHADPASVEVDARQVRQLLLNLVRNAIEAIERHGGEGTVRVSAHVEHDADGARELHLEVNDDGPGLDPEIAPRLFTAFVTGRVGGTGLGLAVCRRIAQAHGGDIVARALEPHGTAMQVVIPLP